MSETMNIEEYLAQGGVLTSPANVPARYRADLLRLMSSFVDSELAGSAGFAASINWAPGIKERISASRITLEKADHAERVLDLMGDFGTDTHRYQSAHDWAARMDRNVDIGQARKGGDMRLSVFHYPITGWTDAVVMNLLMGTATGVQMTELTRVSYAPLAEVFREIAPREARHAELGLEGLVRIVATDAGRAEARAAIAYWHPRVAASFGTKASPRFDAQKGFGLRHQTNEALLSDWTAQINTQLAPLDLV
ncbi:phenylacetate-CoA oxygenase subunit PaaI [Rhodobacteraceae bacterium KMM 6894]|nr:phenylacetate-CoA oxygenase subunit PaaI [Rhodobacteraceae bacterium KMM 6894]